MATGEREAAPGCFDVVVEDNSPATNALFDVKQCQGGGVTWKGLLLVLLRRRGTVVASDAHNGWTGEPMTLLWSGGSTALAIDEEGSAALLCTDSMRLAAELKSDVKRLNSNAEELERALQEGDPDEVECEALAK